MENSCYSPGNEELTDNGLAVQVDNQHINPHAQHFPKNVGIVFLVDKELKYHFEKIYCSHLLLQINNCQKLFNFKIMDLGEGKLEDVILPESLKGWDKNYI
jgi:hypothetical protein